MAGSRLPAWLPPMSRPPLLSSLSPSNRQRLTDRPMQLQKQHSNPIQVLMGDRWFGAGTSGSGKTTWGKHLIAGLFKLSSDAGLYVLDSKGDPKDFDGWPGIMEQAAPPRPMKRRDIQVWRPPRDDLAAYDAWFEGIREARRPAVVLVDELSTISDKSGEGVQGYQKLQKMGRSLGITTVTFSQELAGIDRRVIGQVTHFVRFGMMGEYDQRRANVLMGRGPKEPEPPDPYGFWYLRVDQKPYRPHYYQSWEKFF